MKGAVPIAILLWLFAGTVHAAGPVFAALIALLRATPPGPEGTPSGLRLEPRASGFSLVSAFRRPYSSPFTFFD
jgi:hypothetical protein